MKQRTKHLTVICLAVLLLLTLCTQAFALQPPKHMHSESEELSPDVTVTYNPDGSETYDIALTAEPSTEEASSEPDAIVDQGTHFENAGDAVDLRIEKEFQEGQPLVTVGAEGTSVSFYPMVEQNGASDASAVTAEQQPGDDSVLYEGLFDEDSDVKLYATQRGVKEDIIVAAYTGNHAYPYRMTFDGIVPVQIGNEIRLFSGEQLVGRIVAPYMYDAAGETSTDIQVGFCALSSGEYELTYTPSDAWLSDPVRAYPVTIDPYIDYYLGASAGAPTTSIAATYVNAGSPSSNYGGSGTLYAGGAYTTFVQPYIRSDIMNYSANTLILAAYLKPQGASNPTAINIYPVLSSWSTGSITAGNMPQLGSALPNGARWVSYLAAWDIAPIVGSWFDAANPQPNYGIAVGNAGGGVCSMSSSFTVSITIYRITENISPSATGYANGCENGYVTVNWNRSPLAEYVEYYLIGIFNGREYEYIRSDLNAGSWSTQGKKIWPTPAEIAAGRYKLHLDGSGAELPASPLATYRNANPSASSNAYQFVILPQSWSTITDLSGYVYQPANPGYSASATIPNTGTHSYVYGPWQQHNALQHKRQVTCSNSGCSYSAWEYANHSTSIGSWASISDSQHARTKSCSVCGYVTNETANHSFAYGAWTSDGATRHKRTKTCSVCGYSTTKYADHAFTYGEWTSDNATRHKRTKSCSTCGYSVTEYADHSFEYGGWTPVDDTRHSRSKTCPDCDYSTTEYGNHHDDDGDGRCDDCGYEMNNKALVIQTVDTTTGAAVAYARFTVTDVATNTPVKFKLTDNVYYADPSGSVTYVETNSTGQATVRALSRGNLKLTETRTVSGYFPVPAQTVSVQNSHTTQNPLTVTIHYTKEIILGMDTDRYDGLLAITGIALALAVSGLAVRYKRRRKGQS